MQSWRKAKYSYVIPLFVHKKQNCCEAGDQKGRYDGNYDDQVEGNTIVSWRENIISTASTFLLLASKSVSVSQTLTRSAELRLGGGT